MSPVAGTLLRPPLGEEGSDPASASRSEVKFPRSSAENYENKSEEFRLVRRDFNRQYFHVYSHRLRVMAPRVKERLKETGIKAKVLSLCDLKEAKGGEAVIIGTLFKQQELKPNILKDLSDENDVTPQPAHKKYVSEKDELILEDDMQRIKVRGKADKVKLVTGVVCGLRGAEKESGKFEVEEIIYPKAAAQVPRPVPESDKFVVLVSGLELADRSSSTLSSLQLAVDWIAGDAGEMSDQSANAGIVRVLVCGNSLSESTRDKDTAKKAKYLTKDNDAASIEAVTALDDLLVQLAGSVSVDVLPGEYDPANQIMPQQPLHPCLFPKSSTYPTLKTVPNPYRFSVEGTESVVFSGQNTQDIMRNTDMDDTSAEGPLEALESVLEWSHWAPTCPDTLGYFPYRDSDPFVIEAMPHLVVSGNSEAFGQRTYKKDGVEVKMISVPKFSKTQSLVLLNLRTFEAEEVSFECDI